ncbi:MAG: 30S ribosomal protein S27e [Candidatus Heimdallarchaeota archaeon]|nr:30S ribosomal protein S27e [Candidatus Heimdallarchaeota archaeon]HUU79653.1 30S ribosomal protein S27e [candidate division Zixibacteria bacterium]
MSEPLIPKPKSEFIQVECPDCNKVQRIFSHSSTDVHCLVCNCLLAKPAGGKCKIIGKIVEPAEKKTE